MNGILQEKGKSYNIFGSTIVFSQDIPYFVSESGDKTYSNVSILVFYGRDLQKSATFHDFEPDTYYNKIKLGISGVLSFIEFIRQYSFSDSTYAQVFQKDTGKINVIGKIRGYEQIDTNYWNLIISGNNPIFDENSSIFIGPENDYTSDSVIELNSDLIIQPLQIFVSVWLN